MSPDAAILIIGNEILSGRTREANIQYLAKKLGERGITLKEARVIPDEILVIANVVTELSRNYTYVFTTGGIGSTHDDRTAAALAQAFNVDLCEHPQALQILQTHYRENLNEARRRMALMPAGALLIDNPVSKAPAFQIENVFVLAGIPSVMQGMFESLGDRLLRGIALKSICIHCQLAENIIADELAQIQNEYPTVEIGSYPFFQETKPAKAGVSGVNIVIRATEQDLLEKAKNEIFQMIVNLRGKPEICEES